MRISSYTVLIAQDHTRPGGGHERPPVRTDSETSAQAQEIAYMLGALQLRALCKELVESGRMSAMQFHDAVLTGGPMAIELVRARLSGLPVERDMRSSWRFYDSLRR